MLVFGCSGRSSALGDPGESDAERPFAAGGAGGGTGGSGAAAITDGGVGGKMDAGGVTGTGGAATFDGGGGAGGGLVDTRPVLSASVSGYRLMVQRGNPDGTPAPAAPFDMRGVSWSPSAPDLGAPGAATYSAWVSIDAPLMKAAGINTVKTYGPVPRAVLDVLLQNGIVAVVTVLTRSTTDYATTVTSLRSHPAILMWVVGNEWNRNSLYGTCTADACYTRVNQVASDIKRLDPAHPVATSFAPAGELPTVSDLARLPAVDVWGLNIYSQPGFGSRFLGWRELIAQLGTSKPFYMSEYGADAYNNLTQMADPASQAKALTQQTQEIRAQLSARNPVYPCLGGAPFEWNDEWWKTGSSGAQDTGGAANPGVAPDQYANEDWWGLVDIDRRPRAGYSALQSLYVR